jgi:hypothetical protein
MKIKALLVALFVAGVSASFALGAGKHSQDSTTTSTVTTTTTTTTKTHCHAVSLSGTATAGSVAFKITKGSKSAKSLIGTTPTLTIPAGARVHAVATVCGDNLAGLTLRSLTVGVPHGANAAEHHGDKKK